MDADENPDATQPETEKADQRDAASAGSADRAPTPEEERMAEKVAEDVSDDVGEHYKDMAETGANLEGEGAVES